MVKGTHHRGQLIDDALEGGKFGNFCIHCLRLELAVSAGDSVEMRFRPIPLLQGDAVLAGLTDTAGVTICLFSTMHWTAGRRTTIVLQVISTSRLESYPRSHLADLLLNLPDTPVHLGGKPFLCVATQQKVPLAEIAINDALDGRVV